MVYTTHFWWFRGWLIIALTTDYALYSTCQSWMSTLEQPKWGQHVEHASAGGWVKTIGRLRRPKTFRETPMGEFTKAYMGSRPTKQKVQKQQLDIYRMLDGSKPVLFFNTI